MPEIKQVFTVGHPRAVVWAEFQNLPKIVGCIPGASLTEQASPQHAKGRMTVKLGPVRADFAGEMEISVDEPNYTGTIVGAGIDKSHGSRAKGNVTYKLEETADGRGTKVVVSVDYTLSGSLAQFARGGIVDAVADQICKDFTINLEEQLNAAHAPVAAAVEGPMMAEANGAVPSAPAPASARKGASELNVLGLIAAIIRNKIRGLFRKSV